METRPIPRPGTRVKKGFAGTVRLNNLTYQWPRSCARMRGLPSGYASRVDYKPGHIVPVVIDGQPRGHIAVDDNLP
jgi:hypothetical protein